MLCRFGEHPLVNEGLALSVQRSSVRSKFDVDGSKKQAAVELIGRCLSSRAIRGGSSAVLVLFQQTAGFCVHANNASRVVVLGVFDFGE